MDAHEAPQRGAWQPLTFGGVAAFAHAPLGRLLAAQFIVALSTALAVACFFQVGWNPSIESAIEQLPEQGEIRDGKLQWPDATAQSFGESSLVSFVIDPANKGDFGQSADLQFVFAADGMRVHSFLGHVSFRYPTDRTIPFNRHALKPWWGARRTAATAFVALALSGGVYLTWCLLALLYCVPVRIMAFYGDRDLTWGGAWKLAAAGLLSGALCMNAAILAYAFHRLNLLQFLAVSAAHCAVGWVFVFAAIPRLPRSTHAASSSIRPKNPFAIVSKSHLKPGENPP